VSSRAQTSLCPAGSREGRPRQVVIAPVGEIQTAHARRVN
jgi:hypothetical protein